MIHISESLHSRIKKTLKGAVRAEVYSILIINLIALTLVMIQNPFRNTVFRFKSICLRLMASSLFLATNTIAQDSTMSIDIGINVISFQREFYVTDMPMLVERNAFYLPLSGAMIRWHKNENTYRGRINYFQINFNERPGSMGDCKDCYISTGVSNNFYFGIGKQFYLKSNSSKLRPYYGLDVGFSYHSYQGISDEIGGETSLKTSKVEGGFYGNLFGGLELKIFEKL